VLIQSELPPDQTAKTVDDLSMTWDRSLTASPWVEIDIVSGAMTVENASRRFQFSDKVAPFHTETSISLVQVLGVGGGPSSSTIIR
jgi:hypothetical protein